MAWQDHISADPNVCHGKVCIKGTRVMVSIVLENLADGMTAAEIAEAWGVSEAGVKASLEYAAAMAKEIVVDLPGAA